jgi:hypothetical protein
MHLVTLKFSAQAHIRIADVKPQRGGQSHNVVAAEANAGLAGVKPQRGGRSQKFGM